MDIYTNLYIVCIGHLLIIDDNVLNLLLDLFNKDSDIPIHNIMCALFNMLQWNNLLDESIIKYINIKFFPNKNFR